MNITKLNIIISFLQTALSASAIKYQIRALNTPAITIDNKVVKVGDWFDDESVVVWSKDNQAMRVVSEDNKVYTLSAKLYKESKSKKFSDFIIYTKPLAARGTNNLDLIEQLAERFDNTFVMLDEIVIDLSGIEFSKGDSYEFVRIDNDGHESLIVKKRSINQLLKDSMNENDEQECLLFLAVTFCQFNEMPSTITESLEIEVLPISQK